ncbi:MAG: VCBS repeat-containing protein, partial [Flavobacteriaceae bacterium]
MDIRNHFGVVVLTICLLGCNPNITKNEIVSQKRPLYELMSVGQTGLNFTNTIVESPRLNGLVYEYLYNGGGVAAGDFNDDGLVDLFFTANLIDNALFLNEGNLRFKKVTAQARVLGKKGFSTGVTTVDINGDGRLDIYVSKSGNDLNLDLSRNELYINKGNNSNGVPDFEERAS